MEGADGAVRGLLQKEDRDRLARSRVTSPNNAQFVFSVRASGMSEVNYSS